jgi:hypothetical protein
MTRHHDLDITLRLLDPAEPEVDAHSPRATADLERILASTSAVLQARPRRHKTARRLALVGAAAAAVASAAVVLPSLTGGDQAFATWTPTPRGLSPADRTAAATRCRAAQQDGPGSEYGEDLRDADPVIVERRGAWTTVVLAGHNGFSALCITDESTRWFRDWFGSVGTPSDFTTPGPRALIATDLGTGTNGAGDLSLAAGAAGTDVAAVVFASRTHGDVAATVSRGRFALWLPGDELIDAATTGIEVEVSYLDGTKGTSLLHL